MPNGNTTGDCLELALLNLQLQFVEKKRTMIVYSAMPRCSNKLTKHLRFSTMKQTLVFFFVFFYSVNVYTASKFEASVPICTGLPASCCAIRHLTWIQ